MAKTDQELAQALAARKLVTPKQLERVTAKVGEGECSLLSVLIESGLATDGVLSLFAEEAGLRVIDLAHDPVDASAAAILDPRVAMTYGVLPVGFEGERLLVAMADPDNSVALDEVAAMTGRLVEPVLASRPALARAIELAYMPPAAPEAESALERPSLEVVPDQDNAPEVSPPAPKPTTRVHRDPAPSAVVSSEPEVVRIGRRIGVDDETPVIDLHELLEQVLVRDASDLHLTAGVPPVVRVHGDLVQMSEYDVLRPNDLQKLVYNMIQQKQREKLETDLELDLSYSLPGKARFRVNVYVQRGVYGAAFRLIPFQIKSVDDLGLPARISEFARLPRGLVVMTGPTGSGKSTTLASIVDIVNRERACHIMTIEDPIEFLHTHKRAIVNQREVGADTHGFAPALRHVLRQDPDVILVGEMRDLETIHMAVTAAETGHLVFGTLHTQDAPQTVDRIIDVFPPHQQQQIRVQLASSLMGVVAQQLLVTRDGHGRVAAAEVMVVTPAIRNLIREGKTHQIYSSMQAGGKQGMVTMDAALAELVRRGKVNSDVARERCHNVEEFLRLSSGSGSAARPAAASKARVVG